jgi:hypothetical protein
MIDYFEVAKKDLSTNTQKADGGTNGGTETAKRKKAPEYGAFRY